MRHRAQRARAFTLIELLVVIGILALLAGILIPAVIKALAAAQRSRVSAELSTIATALGQYHDDFTRYPSVDVPNSGAAVLGKALLALGPSSDPAPNFVNTASYSVFDRVNDGSGNIFESVASNPAPSTPPPAAAFWKAVADYAQTYSAAVTYLPGTVVLYSGKLYVSVIASTGQTPAITPPSPPVIYWATFDWSDGASLGQYRTQPGGKVRDAYLQPDKFKTNGTDILDGNGNPILYFPGRPASTIVNITKGSAPGTANDTDVSTARRGTYFDQATVGAAAVPPWQPKYDANANLAVFQGATNAERLASARVVLGDVQDPAQPGVPVAPNGAIDASDTAVAKSEFILWAAGKDGKFGPAALTPNDIGACDDVIVSQ